MRFAAVVVTIFAGAFLVASWLLKPNPSAASARPTAIAGATPTLPRQSPPTKQVGVIVSSAPKPAAPTPPADKAHRSVQKALAGVRDGLRDPESVRFKNLWAYRAQIETNAPEMVFVCGAYNSKNGFGGYTGYQPFVAMEEVIVTPADGDMYRYFNRKVCEEGERLFPVPIK